MNYQDAASTFQNFVAQTGAATYTQEHLGIIAREQAIVFHYDLNETTRKGRDDARQELRQFTSGSRFIPLTRTTFLLIHDLDPLAYIEALYDALRNRTRGFLIEGDMFAFHYTGDTFHHVLAVVDQGATELAVAPANWPH